LPLIDRVALHAAVIKARIFSNPIGTLCTVAEKCMPHVRDPLSLDTEADAGSFYDRAERVRRPDRRILANDHAASVLPLPVSKAPFVVAERRRHAPSITLKPMA